MVRAPLWSVMIPTYRPRRDLLERAIGSVLPQSPSRSDMQIEIVDDGSKDAAWLDDLPSQYLNRVEVYRSSENTGIGDAWNRCISRARGSLVHILHQDDQVLPGFYCRLEEGMRRYPHAAAAVCRYAIADELGNWLTIAHLESPTPRLLDDATTAIAMRDLVQCAGIVVRRSTYGALGGFHKGLTHALDIEMWVRIAASSPIYYDPEILAIWTRHESATTSQQIRLGENTLDIAKAITIWRKHLPEPRSSRLAKAVGRRHSQVALSLGEYLLRENHRGGAMRHLQAALACHNHPQTLFSVAIILIRAMLRKMRPRRGPVSN